MKKLAFSIAGAMVLGVICIGLAWLLGHLFGPLYSSEAESTRNFKIFLFSFMASIALGAFIGAKAANKQRQGDA